MKSGSATFTRCLAKGVKKGIFIVSRPFPVNRIPVVAYHCVGQGNSVLDVSPETFRKQLAYLKNSGYRTLCLSEYLRASCATPDQVGGKRNRSGNPSLPDGQGLWLRDSSLYQDSKQLLITFDDGFGELYTYAFPILKEFSFTAVVFVPTDYIGQPASWIQRDMDDISARLLPNISLTNSEVAGHIRHLERLSKRQLLSWSQICEMNEYGIDFQSHSCSHPFFSKLDRRQVFRELKDSKATLEARLQNKVQSFAYPYGDYSHLYLRTALRETGYTLAFCDSWSPSRDKVGDMYEVNRIPIGNDTVGPYLELCFSVGFQWYRCLASFVKRFI